MQKNMYYSALCFIRNKWPLTSSPSFVISPPIPLCLPLPGSVFQNTQSLVLLFISSWGSACGVISFATECSHMDKCALFVSLIHVLMLELMLLCVCVLWMRTWSYCVEFCRKHWAHWSVCSNRRTVSLFRELYEWFGKLCQRNQLSCVSNREKL